MNLWGSECPYLSCKTPRALLIYWPIFGKITLTMKINSKIVLVTWPAEYLTIQINSIILKKFRLGHIYSRVENIRKKKSQAWLSANSRGHTKEIEWYLKFGELWFHKVSQVHNWRELAEYWDGNAQGAIKLRWLAFKLFFSITRIF